MITDAHRGKKIRVVNISLVTLTSELMDSFQFLTYTTELIFSSYAAQRFM